MKAEIGSSRELDCRNLVAFEALYMIVRELALEKHLFISREAFCRMPFPLVTTCDGLLALVSAGLPINLLMQTPKPIGPLDATRPPPIIPLA